jgi:hypothetical protein
MSFFTRCFTKKRSIESQNDSEHRKAKEEIKQAENRQRLYNELHFSSGLELPIHPKILHPSHILDKKLVIGQFGEPQKGQRLAEAVKNDISE